MKKRYKFAAVFSAVLMSAVLLTACSGEVSITANPKESSAEISQSQSDTENNAANPNSNGETEILHESSDEESSNAEQSENVQNSESTESSDTSEKSDESEPSESSEQPPQESEEDGYYFDDEQIVDDYHTATEFTDNEEFNKLFLSNKIDANYQQELQDASTISKMRTVTANYAEIWKTEEEKVYKNLLGLLSDKREAKSALEVSEQEWKDGVQEAIDGFYADIDPNNSGSEELLSADTAVMNYYKGRTAKLYEQIYQLTGEFNM
ncbi:MAG: hypothetical protein ACI4GV_05975 [Acutalibacteraceae bacterium]